MATLTAPEKAMTAEDAERLMLQYKKSMDLRLRNELVVHYQSLAQRVAMRMRPALSQHLQYEDLVSQGMIALIDSVEKFAPDKGVKFEQYASIRIRQSIIDYLRKQGWLPRRVRLASKDISQAHKELCNTLMREPTQKELAEYLNISLASLSKSLSEISNFEMLSFEEFLENVCHSNAPQSPGIGDTYEPDGKIMQDELREILKGSIDLLTDQERLVISLYYYENLKLSEIAGILKVSDQRTSQIHTKAIKKLRSRIEEYMKG